jgi:mannose-1-phosphate guanylyltransferase
MTRAMMLCAGRSTRLNGLANELPKPLAPVCDIAIVRYGIALLVAHGIRDIVINLHHLGELFTAELGDGAALGARIQYSREPDILGTGGGVKRALSLLDPGGDDEPFLVLNGKLVFDLDLTALLAAHRADADVLGTMVVRKLDDPAAFRAVDVDTSGAHPRVRNILGSGGYMFCGVQVTRASVMRNLPDGECCSVRQGYLPWLRTGGQVGAFEVGREYFAEHSTPRRYLDSNLAMVRGANLRFPPGQLTGVDPSAEIDDRAEIRAPVRIAARARIEAGAIVGPDAIVGADAVVAADADISQAVVWSGARAQGRLRDCIVARHSVDGGNVLKPRS